MNGNGDGGKTTGSATPGVAGLAATASLTVTPGTGSLQLVWAPVPGATTYYVFKGTASGAESPAPYVGVSGSGQGVFTDSGVTAGTTYYYTVAAYDGDGVGSMSSEASATAGATTLPAPSGASAAAGYGQVDLAWTNLPQATGYVVYRGLAGASSAPYATVAAGSTGYVDVNVTAGVSCSYQIAGLLNSAQGTKTSTVSATPLTPGLPGGPSATGGTAQIALSWTAATGATGYAVYRSATSGGEGTTVYATSATTSFTDTGLASGATWFYTVAATYPNGVTSAQSTEVSAITAPAAPTSLTATGATGSVTLSWTAATGAATYSVYRGTATGAESATAIATGLTTPSYSDTSATNGTTYFYTVAAANTGGTSAPSTEASATPLSAPSITSVTAASSSELDLAWGSVTGAAQYKVETSATGTSGWSTLTDLTATTYANTGLPAQTAEWYRVTALAPNSASTPSATATGTTLTTAPSLTATAGVGTVTLSWTAAPGATGYDVYRATTTGGPYTKLTASPQTATTYSDTSVTDGTPYWYVATMSISAVKSPKCRLKIPHSLTDFP